MSDHGDDAVQLEWLGINGFRLEYRGRKVLLDELLSNVVDGVIEFASF